MQEIDQVGWVFLLQESRIRYLTLTGIKFQNLFAAIMQNAWPSDFQKVKPYGRYGDLKCDGYVSESQMCVSVLCTITAAGGEGYREDPRRLSWGD